MSNPYKDRPNTIPWPPIIYVTSGCAAFLLAFVFPISDPLENILEDFAFFSGLTLSLCGLGLVIWAIKVMTRHGANIIPTRAATRLVSDGPFRFSRNPIYLGDTILLIGLGVMFSNAWFYPGAIIATIATHFLVILREEAHLAALFADEWIAYKASVPRWIGWRL